MSANLGEPKLQYLGILNGVVYRIDSEAGDSGRPFDLQPFKVQSPELVERFALRQTKVPVAPRTDAVRPAVESSTATAMAPLPREEAIVDGPGNDKVETVSTLFKREGAEPLRAGHPEMWKLLVAGSCLEGSTFRAV